MYAFVDHTSHDYTTDAAPKADTLTPDAQWLSWQTGAGGPARPVLPTGFALETLLPFEDDEIEAGWHAARTAQLIGSTFAEMFDVTRPDYHDIARAAQAWQQSLTDAFHGDAERAEEFKVARQLLQGVIDAARSGIARKPTRWSPSRRGLNLDTCAPSPKPSKGNWYEAKALDGGAWCVRKSGERVEALRLDDGTSITLTPAQARRSLSILGKVA